QRLTYRQLNNRANQLAHYLRQIGVAREIPVAICVDRSLEMLVGVLAILKAGGAYVPLSSDYPPHRLMIMLKDTDAPLLITSEEHLHLFGDYFRDRLLLDGTETQFDGFNRENPGTPCAATDLAYVMYTSGSTGDPKGTSIVHRSVVRLVQNTNYLP